MELPRIENQWCYIACYIPQYITHAMLNDKDHTKMICSMCPYHAIQHIELYSIRVPRTQHVLLSCSLCDAKSFQELLWKWKSKIKIIAEPVAAMAAGGPAAGGRRQASSLGRPKAGPSLDLNPSNPFQKPLEVQQTLALGLSEEAQCSLGANLNGTSRLLLNCPSGRQGSSSPQLINLVVYLHAKFVELNLRIKETRSSENRSTSSAVSQILYPTDYLAV